MFENLAVFRTAGALARHAAEGQALVARNIANADTPGYRAQHLAAFGDSFAATGRGLTATRPGHLTGTTGQTRLHLAEAATEGAPNGNAVSLEHEMVQAVEMERNHNRALAIYRHAMTVLRSSLGS